MKLNGAERWLRFQRVSHGPARWFRDTGRKSDYNSLIKRRVTKYPSLVWAETEKL